MPPQSKKSPVKIEIEIASKVKALESINDQINALRLPLALERKANKTFPVIGDGNLFANIMLIGEAPGKKESLTGKPFCGALGKFLDQLLESVGIKREDVYITNIVKDRPANNRDPSAEEIKAYGSFLDEQINIIQPNVIASLGRFSMVYIFEKYGIKDQLDVISQMHGRSFIAKTEYGIIKIIPLYHPAVALYNGGMRQTLFDDFKIMKDILKRK